MRSSLERRELESPETEKGDRNFVGIELLVLFLGGRLEMGLAGVNNMEL